MSDFLRRKLRERQAGHSDQPVDIFRRRMDQAVRENHERQGQAQQRSSERARQIWQEANNETEES